MNKKNYAFTLFLRTCVSTLLMFFVATVSAQNITVRGTVQDATGEPVIGATVQVQGANTGVITDVNGNYSISCQSKSTLSFSYVGFKTKLVPVNGRSTINVVFDSSSTDLNEVVVTALGIKREAKALGYAVTEVKSDEIRNANTISPVAALQGKVAGVEINQSDGGMFGSPDLQNEYIEGYFPGAVEYGDDYDKTGNRWSDNMSAYSRNSSGEYSMINQNDNTGIAWGPNISWAKDKKFEQYDGSYGSMSIFKNNYKDAYKTGFNSNTNVSIQGGDDRTTFYTSLSYKYANGTTPRNTFNRFSFLGKASHKISKNVMIDFAITFVQSKPRNAQRNIGEYFATGTFPREYDVNKYQHLYKGTHGGLASGTYGDEYRSVPGRDLWWSIYEDEYYQKETTVRPVFDLTVFATNWLTFKVGGNLNYYYIDSEGKYPGSGYANEGGSYSLSHKSIKQENLYASATVNKQLNDDFEVHGFLRQEYFNQHAQYDGEWTNGGLIVPNQYFISNSKNQSGSSGYKFNTKRIVSTIFQVGGSWKNQVYLDVTGRNDWSSALVYTSGRGNFSYFYPSVSGSWIISETFRDKLPSWITFGKVRASWAQVGNDTDPYYINSGYSLNSYTYGSNKVYGLSLPSQIKSTNLKPERKNSWELGLDWRFFDDRLGLDFTYYKENTKNQIMAISVPYYSGVSSELINAGNIQNKGVEISLNTTPIKNRDWRWDLNFTYTKNDNKIVSLSDDVANYIVLDGSADYGNYRIASVAEVGGSYGLLKSDSNPKIDEATGLPVIGYTNGYRTIYYKRSGKVETLGSMIPDFLGSVNTTLRWKNLSFYASLDCRFGGYVASYNSRYATAYGYSGTSLNYRTGMTWTSQYSDAKGITYTDGFIPNAVFDKGTTVTTPSGTKVDVSGMTYQQAYDKGYVEPAHLQSFAYFKNSWGNGVINDDWFKKLNYIALREISVSYSFPASIYKYIGAKSLSLSLVGRNLGYLLNTAPNHENPESIRGTGASMFRMRSYGPYTASYLFTINASF
jgi:iron complex outermembrane receptor protein